MFIIPHIHYISHPLCSILIMFIPITWIAQYAPCSLELCPFYLMLMIPHAHYAPCRLCSMPVMLNTILLHVHHATLPQFPMSNMPHIQNVPCSFCPIYTLRLLYWATYPSTPMPIILDVNYTSCSALIMLHAYYPNAKYAPCSLCFMSIMSMPIMPTPIMPHAHAD